MSMTVLWPEEGWLGVLYQPLSAALHGLQVFREVGQWPLGVVIADPLQLAVPDVGSVLDGVSVDHLGFCPGAPPDGDLRPGELADHVVAPHVAEYDGPELILESAAVSQGHPVLHLLVGAAVQPHHVVLHPGGLDSLRDLLQPGDVMAFNVEFEVVFLFDLGDPGGGYVWDLRHPAEIQPVSQGDGAEVVPKPVVGIPWLAAFIPLCLQLLLQFLWGG